jgi:hypothetical protein
LKLGFIERDGGFGSFKLMRLEFFATCFVGFSALLRVNPNGGFKGSVANSRSGQEFAHGATTF